MAPDRAESYRRHAASNRELAQLCRSEQARAVLLEIADRFDRLAEQASGPEVDTSWLPIAGVRHPAIHVVQ
jgi:hypothetical protein